MNEFMKQHLGKETGLRSRLFLFILILFTLPAITRAAEIAKKTFIDADHMHMNIISGKSVYTGNVIISQGELVLTGDKVTVERSNEEIERITVIGKPAKYKHVTEAGESIKAQSEHMLYIANQNKLVMTIDARLQQPDLKLSSQKITYDTEKKIVIAGDSDGVTAADSKTKQTQRVNIVITPKKSPAAQ
jgi:lipopolysaccharide export system protein LptA